jgi:hypothetical protein
MDYLFRRLALEYLTYDERAELGIMSVGERLQPTLPGVEETVVETTRATTWSLTRRRSRLRTSWRPRSSSGSLPRPTTEPIRIIPRRRRRSRADDPRSDARSACSAASR